MGSEVRKVRSLGNSLIVALPPQVLDEMSIELGEYVCIECVNDEIVIKKVRMNGENDE